MYFALNSVKTPLARPNAGLIFYFRKSNLHPRHQVNEIKKQNEKLF